MIITCAIIDDEPLAADLLESYAEKTPFLQLKGKYNSAVEAISIIRREPVDLLFLDIQMPELSGLEFATLLPSATKIVFTTAFNRYAIDSYKVNTTYYLLKPISYDEFLKASTKVLNQIEQLSVVSKSKQDADFFYVRSEGKMVRICYKDIAYIEALKDYVVFHLAQYGHTVSTIMNLKSVEEHLCHLQFMRVHRSYVVNMRRIEIAENVFRPLSKQEHMKLRMEDGTYVPVSDSYREKVLNYLGQHTIE